MTPSAFIVLRMSLDMSRAELADALGMTATAIGNIERGFSEFRRVHYLAILGLAYERGALPVKP